MISNLEQSEINIPWAITLHPFEFSLRNLINYNMLHVTGASESGSNPEWKQCLLKYNLYSLFYRNHVCLHFIGCCVSSFICLRRVFDNDKQREHMLGKYKYIQRFPDIISE